MTDRIVIDTNVLIVANGNGRDDTPADLECEFACIATLEAAIIGKHIILLDTSNLIMDEYSNYCNYSGEPGVGDEFFRLLYDRQWSEESTIEQVPIQETSDKKGGFANLPPNSFDKSDRKFLSVAEAGDGRVVNATDSDWSEHADFIDCLGVCVLELCPQCLKQAKN